MSIESTKLPTIQEIISKENEGQTLSVLELYIKQHCPDDENKSRIFMIDLLDFINAIRPPEGET